MSLPPPTKDDYAELYEGFRWQVPLDFNIAQACCTRWAGDPERIAIRYEDDAGHSETHPKGGTKSNPNPNTP